MSGKLIIYSLAIAGVLVLSGCSHEKAQEMVPMPPESEKMPENSATMKIYTPEEVATHNTPGDCWTSFQGKVYDITSAVPKHPAGPDKAAKACGQDISDGFLKNPKHAATGINTLDNLQIGELKK